MRKWIGVICIFLGVVCVLSAAGIVVYNRWEDKRAEEISQSLLEDIQGIIEEKHTESDKETTESEENPTESDEGSQAPLEMPTVEVGGYECIGIISIPVLELELPVLTDWDYVKLKKAPCHYYGTYYEKDFVIAAHYYQSHFGGLSELQPGDIVFFTDVNGVNYYYEVILLETLPKAATKEMITSGFDLSLYTCTPDGVSRVTVRCNAVKDSN